MKKCVIWSPDEKTYLTIDDALNVGATEEIANATTFESKEKANEVLSLLGLDPNAFSCPPALRKPRKPHVPSARAQLLRSVATTAGVSEPTVWKVLCNADDVRADYVEKVFAAFRTLNIPVVPAEVG